MIDLATQLMFEVMDDRARGRNRCRHLGATETIERFHFEMLAEGEARVLGQKCVAVVLERVIDFAELLFLLSTDQQLRRRNACEFVQE